jgi:hypothetical protein
MYYSVKLKDHSGIDDNEFLYHMIFDIIEEDIFGDNQKIIGEAEIFLSNDFSNYRLSDIFWEFDANVAGGVEILNCLFKKAEPIFEKFMCLEKVKINYDKLALSDIAYDGGVFHYDDLPRLFILETIKIIEERENLGIAKMVISYLENTYGYSRLKMLFAAPLNNNCGGNYEGIDYAEKQEKLNNFYEKIGYQKANKKPYKIFYKF